MLLITVTCRYKKNNFSKNAGDICSIADMAFAWPTAEIAVMGAAGAANIIHRKEIKEAQDQSAKRKEKI